MTNEEVIAYFKDNNETLISVAKDENVYNYEKKEIEAVCMRETFEANEKAIKALEQQPITWIVGKDNCQVAVRNMPIDKMQKICAIIGEEEQQPSEDCIRELIKEFDNKHPALFTDYMREFNNHPISEIIEYMWDMHDLIEDIEYRLPNEGGSENK